MRVQHAVTQATALLIWLERETLRFSAKETPERSCAGVELRRKIAGKRKDRHSAGPFSLHSAWI
jgi:hypothetical protein